jgi:methylmalonyl-CoA mutase cobalamin-binding subunit
MARSGAGTDETEAQASENRRAREAATARRVGLPNGCGVNVLILPARDEADEIVSLMFAQLLEFAGYRVVTMSHAALVSEMVEAISAKEADMVCVSALPPAAVSHARYLCKRLQAREGEVKMVVGLWTLKKNLERAKERIICDGSVQVVTTLSGAMDAIEQLAKPIVVRQQESATAAAK